MEDFTLTTLDSVIDKEIGQIGTIERKRFDEKLSIELIGQKIKEVRKQKKLTQQQLGALIGVEKAQISKIENSTLNIGLSTIYKVFEALDAEISFEVKY